MSDVIFHDIDHAPDTIEVTSGDIIRSGPIERGVHILGQEKDDGMRAVCPVDLGASQQEHAEFWQGMAFQSDRHVKELEAKIQALRHLVQAADNELASYQRVASRSLPGTVSQLAGERCILNARSALTKAKETA